RSSCREARLEMIAAAAGHPGADNGTGAHALRKFHRGEMLRASHGLSLDKNRALRADFRSEKRIEPLLTFLTQAAGALMNDGLGQLRHARSGCAGPGGERKDMQKGETAFLDDPE